MLDDLYNRNYLQKDDHKFLKPSGSKPGFMYGLCKVHKSKTDSDYVPTLCPILSVIDTCNYNLAKCFVSVLKHVDMVFEKTKKVNPTDNYMFKVNNRNTRTRCEICSKLTIKTPERCQ